MPPDLEIALTVAILALTITAFVREWASPDVVAMVAFAAVVVFGLIAPGEAVAVLSDSAPVTVACMFVIGAGLQHTGCLQLVSRLFEKTGASRPWKVTLLLMVVVAVLSAFVNNTPVVIAFLPVVIGLARRSGKPELRASRLLIPLSYAAILGGTCTLTGTSTNLIVDGVARATEPGFEPFRMFEFTALGLAYATVGFVYMLVVGRRLLPDRQVPGEVEAEAGSEAVSLIQVHVGAGSPLAGKPLTESLIASHPETQVFEIRRKGRVLSSALDRVAIRAGDRLLISAKTAKAASKDDALLLTQLEGRKLKQIEGIVGTGSAFLGKTLRELQFRQRYGVVITGLNRRGGDLGGDINDVPLKVGDTLSVSGPEQAVNRLRRDLDFISLATPATAEVDTRRAWIAAGILVAFAVAAALTPFPVASLAVLAAIAMVASGALAAPHAYRAVQWDIVLVMVGMIALGKAVADTGTADVVTDRMLGFARGADPLLVLACLYLATAVFTELVSNSAVAVLFTPVAITLANQLGVDPRPFVVAVVFGASASFATPVGYQTNTFVFGAGGYKFTDFTKVGAPLNLILWGVATALIPLLWPFYPDAAG